MKRDWIVETADGRTIGIYAAENGSRALDAADEDPAVDSLQLVRPIHAYPVQRRLAIHPKSGDLYAVTLSVDGRVFATAAGPLGYTNVRSALKGYADAEEGLAEWLDDESARLLTRAEEVEIMVRGDEMAMEAAAPAVPVLVDLTILVLPDEDADLDWLKEDAALGHEDSRRLLDNYGVSWSMVGVVARATVSVPLPNSDGVLIPIDSPGLWGISDDSGEHLVSTGKEEVQIVLGILTALHVQCSEQRWLDLHDAAIADLRGRLGLAPVGRQPLLRTPVRQVVRG